VPDLSRSTGCSPTGISALHRDLDLENGYLRSYDDFSFIAEGVARDLVAQNIRYVAFFSPSDFARHGLKTQELTRHPYRFSRWGSRLPSWPTWYAIQRQNRPPLPGRSQ
jgi:hypothetical protein